MKQRKDKQKPLASLTGTILGGLPFLTKEYVEVFLYKDRTEFSVSTGILGMGRRTFVLKTEKIQDIQRVSTNGNNIKITTTQAGITTVKSTETFFGGSQDILIIAYTDDSFGDITNIFIGLDRLTFTRKFIKEFKKLKPQSTAPIEL